MARVKRAVQGKKHRRAVLEAQAARLASDRGAGAGPSPGG